MKEPNEIIDTLLDVAAIVVGVVIVAVVGGIGLLLAGVFSGRC